MHSKKSNIGMAAKAFLLTAIGLPMGVSAQGVIEEKTDTIVVYPTQHLEEVVIVHQGPIVKLKTDKVTYQVSNDVESKTRSVLDILRKVPMVTVDGRNNIMVNGSAQFKVYVDGRLSTVITRNPKQTLRSMPASHVKNIEVITNPGAQYDAEGTGGVLCITTKKGGAKQALALEDDGYDGATSGSVHLLTGILSNGVDASLSGQQGKWSYDVNLNGEYMYSTGTIVESEVTGNGTRQWMRQKSSSKMPFSMGEVGVGYEIDSVQSLHVSMSTTWFATKEKSRPSYLYSGGMWGQEMTFSGSQKMNMNEISVDGGIDYQRQWGDRGRLFASYQISHAPNRNDTENRYDGLDTSLHPEITSTVKDIRTEICDRTTQHHLSTDLTIPLTRHQQLNTGVKFSFDRGESQATEMRFLNGGFVEQKAATMHYRQYQNIAALYAEWEAQWGWLGLKEGLRYEHTWQKSRYLKGEGSKFSLHYGDLVPSVSLTAKAKENSTFGVSYTMRIRRPRINELDPYVNKSDPTQLSYGNPNLKAQHLNNLAIVHTLRANTLAMRISLNHSWSNDGIVRYSSMKDGCINTTFGNIARNRKTSLNAYASWNATRSTRLMLNGEVGYSDMRSREIDARNYGWHGNLNLGWQQNLPWQLKWSSNLEWMSRRYSLQGYDSGMMMISATLARSFLNDKLDVAISGMSGLGHGGKMYWESVSRAKDFTNISRFIEPMQDITIGITYTFGGKSRKYTEKTVSDSFEMGDSRIVKQQTKRRGKL